MDTLRALELRHSVRAYKDEPIAGDTLAKLQALIKEINEEVGLHIQLVQNHPKAFSGFLASYGSFKNVNNYLALVAKKGKAEELGYYGQMIVLEAQKLGLNTCWVGGTFGKDKEAYDIDRGEKLYMVIAIGYGDGQGHPHKSKPFETLVEGNKDELPDWFVAGAEAAMLAPTAMNQQKFKLSLGAKDKVILKTGLGVMTGIDNGIVKFNFEVGAASKEHDVIWK